MFTVTFSGHYYLMRKDLGILILGKEMSLSGHVQKLGKLAKCSPSIEYLEKTLNRLVLLLLRYFLVLWFYFNTFPIQIIQHTIWWRIRGKSPQVVKWLFIVRFKLIRNITILNYTFLSHQALIIRCRLKVAKDSWTVEQQSLFVASLTLYMKNKLYN